MKSTSLTLSAKACFSRLSAHLLCSVCLAAPCSGQEQPHQNYSLWPQRPQALTAAKRLIAQGDLVQALTMLHTLESEPGVIGKEVKDLIGNLNIRLLLDPNNPHLQTYVVRRGDSWIRVVQKTQCSQDLLVHLNRMTDIPVLHAGDTFKFIPLHFHVVINVPENAICLYDGTRFITAYPMRAVKDTGKKNYMTAIKDKQAAVSMYDKHYPAADKTLSLAAGGFVIDAAAEGAAPRIPGFYLSQQDCNELAMLTRAGNKVLIVREKDSDIPALITEQIEQDTAKQKSRS